MTGNLRAQTYFAGFILCILLMLLLASCTKSLLDAPCPLESDIPNMGKIEIFEIPNQFQIGLPEMDNDAYLLDQLAIDGFSFDVDPTALNQTAAISFYNDTSFAMISSWDELGYGVQSNPNGPHVYAGAWSWSNDTLMIDGYDDFGGEDMWVVPKISSCLPYHVIMYFSNGTYTLYVNQNSLTQE